VLVYSAAAAMITNAPISVKYFWMAWLKLYRKAITAIVSNMICEQLFFRCHCSTDDLKMLLIFWF